MAANTYVKTAITQIQSALMDLNNQIQGSEHDIKEQHKQVDQAIHKLEQERNTHSMEMNHAQDDIQRQALHDRIQKIDHEIGDLRVSVSRHESEISSTMQRKSKAYNNLQNLSSQLTRMVSSPDLR